MGVRHIAMFRFAETTSAQQVAEITRALGDLPDVIEGLRDYRFGADLGLSDRTWDFGVVADFDDAGAYERYRTHPAHVEVVEQLIGPLVEQRAAVQIET